eukprot:jgi/Mesen1/4994/ME000248S04276
MAATCGQIAFATPAVGAFFLSNSCASKPSSSVSLAPQKRRSGCSSKASSWTSSRVSVIRSVAMQDSMVGMDEDGAENEPRKYPPGLSRYESMVVLRPDLSEDERNALTERYEEYLVAGGAIDVEMFNRGMQPLAYNIKTKNMGGQATRYLDGIYLLFSYVTKPESQVTLQKKFNTDDDVIRSTTFKLKI